MEWACLKKCILCYRVFVFKHYRTAFAYEPNTFNLKFNIHRVSDDDFLFLSDVVMMFTLFSTLNYIRYAL